ncbi:MAG: transcriptional repressor [Acidimicrobiales bacterium]|nr:transcriptional repressor [Acidimicrobiales bacterium]
MKSPDELTDLFRARGLKVTPQRQLIFRVLHDELAHPTADAVYAMASTEMPTMSLRTVYQTLNDLTAMGEIEQIDLGTGSARFDTNLDTHQHLVCERCGAVRDVVVDFTAIDLDEDNLEGFAVSSTDIVFRGRCAACTDPEQVSSSRLPKENTNHA